jgi:hypothetical protein
MSDLHEKLDQEEVRAKLYHNGLSLTAEDDDLLRNLWHELSKVLEDPVDVEYYQPINRLGYVPPWLEIVLAFSSITVATSFLSKFGEDIYNQLKAKLKETFTKKKSVSKHQTYLAITITIDKMVAHGVVVIEEDYEVVAEALKVAPEMFLDIQEIKGDKLEERQKEARLNRDACFANQPPFFPSGIYSASAIDKVKPLSVLHSGMRFDYLFDMSNQKWILIGIHKM